MKTNAPNVLIPTRSRIAAQNLMEGDEFLLRGEDSIFVESIKRNEAKGTVVVSFDDGDVRRFQWDQKVSIDETPERQAFRRNLRRNGYPNYLEASDDISG